MMEPRVLVVAPRLDTGGAEIHLLRVLPRLRREGLDVSLFTIARGGRIERDMVATGVPVLGSGAAAAAPGEADAGPVRGEKNTVSVFERTMRNLRTVRALRGEISRLQPDILHFFLPEPYLIGSLAAAGLGGICKIMSRRSLSDYQRNHLLLARLERLLHRSTKALVANSSAVADQLFQECGERDKIGIIHNGIDLPPPPDAEIRATRRRELGIPADSFVIAVVANLIPYKGHADLVDALAGARERLRAAWRLVLIGRDEGTGTELRQRARMLGIDANILWLGERSDAQAVLAAADIGVLPSHQEGFSNSVIEKMAQALPVVATRVGGNSDAIVDGESGLLVPVADPPALGAAVSALYEDVRLRARLGVAARNRVERLFTLDACVRRYLNLYRGIVANKGVPVAQLIDPLDEDISTAAKLGVLAQAAMRQGKT